MAEDPLFDAVGGLFLAGLGVYALALVIDLLLKRDTAYRKRWKNTHWVIVAVRTLARGVPPAPPVLRAPVTTKEQAMPYGYTPANGRVVDGAKMDREHGLAPRNARVLHFAVAGNPRPVEAAADMCRRYAATEVWTTDRGGHCVLSLVFSKARRDATEINQRARSFGWNPVAPDHLPGLPTAPPSAKPRAAARRVLGYYMDYLAPEASTDATIRRVLTGLPVTYQRDTTGPGRRVVTLRWQAGFTKQEAANYRAYLETVHHWTPYVRAAEEEAPRPWEQTDPDLDAAFDAAFQGDPAAWERVLARLPVPPAAREGKEADAAHAQ